MKNIPRLFIVTIVSIFLTVIPNYAFVVDGGKLAEKVYCKDSAGNTVAYGNKCVSGGSGCQKNDCPN